LIDAPAPSERLAYEPLGVAHMPLLAAWADPELYRWIGDAPTLAQVASRVSRITTRPPPPGELWRNWVARRRADDACVGVVEATICENEDAASPPPAVPGQGQIVRPTERPGRHALLAYFVFAAFQRRGYAREACAAALAHLHAHHAVRSVVASVDTRNLASQRLVEALGFVREDGLFAADPIGGEPAWDFRYRLVLPDR
jgi:RimJ/RimL family protein N-acetyltransferase